MVRYFSVVPTFQLGPRSQLELGGVTVPNKKRGRPGVPDINCAWGGADTRFSQPPMLLSAGALCRHR